MLHGLRGVRRDEISFNVGLKACREGLWPCALRLTAYRGLQAVASSGRGRCAELTALGSARRWRFALRRLGRASTILGNAALAACGARWAKGLAVLELLRGLRLCSVVSYGAAAHELPWPRALQLIQARKWRSTSDQA